MDSKHLVHQLMVGSFTAHDERLRFSHPFVTAARKLINELSILSTPAARWIDYKWDMKYCKNQSKLRLFVPRPDATSLGMGLLKPAWVRLNRLCTGVGKFQLSMHKWKLVPTSFCECGALDRPQPM